MLLVLTVAFCGVTAEYHAQQCERSAADLYLGTRVVADENVASETRLPNDVLRQPITGQV
jgi:hypothetical protein